ncbi:MAG TPA: EAL domain-containing protein, partial [Gammaproteobacteria bacterium]
RGQRVLKSIVELANAIGTEIIAEGIEKPSQLQHLRRLGVRLGQGRLLGAPMTAADATAVLEENTGSRWRRWFS